ETATPRFRHVPPAFPPAPDEGAPAALCAASPSPSPSLPTSGGGGGSGRSRGTQVGELNGVLARSASPCCGPGAAGARPPAPQPASDVVGATACCGNHRPLA